MIKQRTCIICREKNKKENLLKIVAIDKMAVLDIKQNINTRGMYICNKHDCIQKAINAKNIAKCVKIDVNIESLKELLKNLGE